MFVAKEKEIGETEVSEKDVKGVRMKILLGESQGASNFVMRVFEIEPGGHTAYHTHPWEHEVYVLEGNGAVRQDGKDHELVKGSVVLVKPNEPHQFLNKGREAFKFICVVPIV